MHELSNNLEVRGIYLQWAFFNGFSVSSSLCDYHPRESFNCSEIAFSQPGFASYYFQDAAGHLRPPSGNSIHHAAAVNMTLHQSIYANTVAVPKMNGSAVRHGSNGSNGSSGSSNKTKDGLNTSKLSSSNSPATTNQTKTSYMDSSRDHSHHELENTQLSPINARPAVKSFMMRPSQSPPPPPPLLNGSNVSRYNTSLLSNGGGPGHVGGGDQSLLRSHQLNSTAVHNKSERGHNATGQQRKLNLNASSLLPANVSKFMLLSKEAGVRVAITSLGLLCLVSLLLALLSLVFLLRITPSSSEAGKNYQFEFLSQDDFTSLYEVTLALSALTLVLNLCCLVVCAIQFLFAIKLVKSSHGRQRYAKHFFSKCSAFSSLSCICTAWRVKI